MDFHKFTFSHITIRGFEELIVIVAVVAYWSWSRTPGRRVASPTPAATDRRYACRVSKFGEGMTAQVSSVSLDQGSKLSGPLPRVLVLLYRAMLIQGVSY
ncbi:hypothetical protein TNCV_2269411 [Trichonephila clavipes]|nr:hypothetical protein TNCV_2269411 [Trichonephila clavipes]